MYICKYCGKEFETLQQLGGHVGYCKCNPNRRNDEQIKITSNKIRETYRINHDKKNQVKCFNFVCEKCGNEFSVEMTQSKYESLLKRNELPRFCSSKCSHSRTQSNDTRTKISSTLLKNGEHKRELKEYKKTHCKFCGSLLVDGICNSNHPACNHQSVKWYKNLVPFGFDENVIGTSKIYDEYDKVISLLINEYKSLSPKDIFDKYNVSNFDGAFKTSEALLQLLKSIGVKTRTLSESEVVAWSNTDNFLSAGKNQYKCGYFDTWFGTKVYLRSSYEFDYAKILNDNKINYDVESIRVKYFDTTLGKERIAIPDFLLKDKNEIVEIKSEYTLNVQEMKDKKKAYEKLGYKFRLILEHKEVNIDEL